MPAEAVALGSFLLHLESEKEAGLGFNIGAKTLRIGFGAQYNTVIRNIMLHYIEALERLNFQTPV